MSDLWNIVALGNEAFPYIAEPDSFFSERIAKHMVFVAELDGRFAGFVDMESSKDIYTAVLAGLAVKKEFRGKGIGKALLSFAIRFLKALGYRKVVLITKRDNERALALYRNAGFRETAEKNGIVRMELHLE